MTTIPVDDNLAVLGAVAVVVLMLVVMAMAGEEEVLESVRTGKSNPISH